MWRVANGLDNAGINHRDKCFIISMVKIQLKFVLVFKPNSLITSMLDKCYNVINDFMYILTEVQKCFPFKTLFV